VLLVLERYGHRYTFRGCGHPVATATVIRMPAPDDGETRWCYSCAKLRTVSVARG
jgi:hypothetical protein